MNHDPVPFDNLYVYAANNPIVLTDDNGRFPVAIGSAGTAVIGAGSTIIGTVSAPVVIGVAVVAGAAIVAHYVGKKIKNRNKSKTKSAAYVSNSPKKEIPVIIVPKNRYPESAQHIEEAQLEGHPSQLTRCGLCARKNRRDALKNILTVPFKDRDEYPFASTLEGGKGSSVKHIDFRDNRGSGIYIRHQLNRKGVKEGESYIIRVE